MGGTRPPLQNAKKLVIQQTASISALTRRSQWSLALRRFGAAFGEGGLVMDAPALGTGLTACAKGAQWAQALHLYTTSAVANAACFGALLNAFAAAARWREALASLAAAKEPDIVAFNVSINACTRAAAWPGALALFAEVEARSLPATSVTFNSTATACLRGSLWSVAMDLARRGEEAEEGGTSLATLGASLASCERANRWDQAMWLLYKAQSAGGWDVAAGGSAVASCGALQWAQALSLFETFSNLGLVDHVTRTSAVTVCRRAWQWRAAAALVTTTDPATAALGVEVCEAAMAPGCRQRLQHGLFNALADIAKDPGAIRYGELVPASGVLSLGSILGDQRLLDRRIYAVVESALRKPGTETAKHRSLLAEDELRALREERTAKDATIDFLKTKIATLQNRLAVESLQCGGDGEEIQQRLETERRRNEEMSRELQHAALEIDDLRAELKEARAEVASLQAEVEKPLLRSGNSENHNGVLKEHNVLIASVEELERELAQDTTKAAEEIPARPSLAALAVVFDGSTVVKSTAQPSPERSGLLYGFPRPMEHNPEALKPQQAPTRLRSGDGESLAWRPRFRETWQNRVPKAERQESLQEHFRSVQRRKATTATWRRIDPEPFCLALELVVEDLNPGAPEEKVSAKCHKLLRKLARGMRIGWEWQLLNVTEDLDPATLRDMDFEAVVRRLQTLGPQKQAAYGLIKVGDRHGATTIQRHDRMPQADSAIPSAEEYAAAVASQAATVWHRKAMAMALEALKKAQVEKLLDIGASFSPFREAFPEVVAVDPIPGHASVLEGDFLEVEIRDDIHDVEMCPDHPQKLRAVPAQHFDAALLSLVLRALRSKAQRRSMLQRAARSVRPGGLVVVVERTPLEFMTNAPFEDEFWTKIRLRSQRPLRSLRGTQVYLLDRLPDLPASGEGQDAGGEKVPSVPLTLAAESDEGTQPREFLAPTGVSMEEDVEKEVEEEAEVRAASPAEEVPSEEAPLEAAFSKADEVEVEEDSPPEAGEVHVSASGALLNFFDTSEDAAALEAKRQRVARQIERRRQARRQPNATRKSEE
ncbi:Samtor, partial [Symbiodinium natans]